MPHRPFYPHQKPLFRYALREDHPALFVEMRLGKTLVALRRAKMYRPRDRLRGLRCLVVAPNSALGSWISECEEERIETVWIAGDKKKRQDLFASVWPYTGKPLFVLLNKEGWAVIPEIANAPWDMVLLDESHFIKNPQAKVTKFFMSNFRSVPHRWCLTGTPNPEGDHEFFCQMKFLHSEFMRHNNYWTWRMENMFPDPRGFGWAIKPKRGEEIRRCVAQRAAILRRREVTGLKECKVYENRALELPAEYRKQYDAMEKDFALTMPDGEEKKTMWQGAKWQWLRQMCGGFIDGILHWKGKMDVLLDLLKGELANEKVVVWCSYNTEVEEIAARCAKAGILSGHIWGPMKPREREYERSRLACGRVRVLVVQQAVAQTGMNLSAADTAIYFSEPVGFMARQQTEDRILTVDKLREGSPMLFINLFVKGTVDGDVRQAMQIKKCVNTLALNEVLRNSLKERCGNG